MILSKNELLNTYGGAVSVKYCSSVAFFRLVQISLNYIAKFITYLKQ